MHFTASSRELLHPQAGIEMNFGVPKDSLQGGFPLGFLAGFLRNLLASNLWKVDKLDLDWILRSGGRRRSASWKQIWQQLPYHLLEQRIWMI